MKKRSVKEIKIAILKILNEEGDLTLAQLERKVNTGFLTIKSNCEELETFGAVSITKKDKHLATGRPYFIIGITKQGRDLLKRL